MVELFTVFTLIQFEKVPFTIVLNFSAYAYLNLIVTRVPFILPIVGIFWTLAL